MCLEEWWILKKISLYENSKKFEIIALILEKML